MDTEYEHCDLITDRDDRAELAEDLAAARKRASTPIWQRLLAPALWFGAGVAMIVIGAQHLSDGTAMDRLPIPIGGPIVFLAMLTIYIRADTRDVAPIEVAGLEHRLAFASARVDSILEVEAERKAARASE